jgi:hypothetical protein
MFKRLIASLVCVTFSFSNLQYVQAQDFSINQLPVPGTMIGESAPFAPLALKGLIVNPQKPLEFQFIVDTGKGPQDTASIKEEANQLVKYFLAGLTIPEGDLWVNLSPYEKNKMVPEALGQTDLGRDLLAQDYILKQLTASLIYPEKDLGKEFWSRVYAKAQQQFGTTNVPVNTFNKVWILPDQAQVYENVNAAYVTKSTLKVMLDEDYLALQKHTTSAAPRNDTHSIGSQIVRQIILPEIEKEVNTGKNFAPLRQIYQALILAKWYKETIQNGLLDAVYTNKNKVAGVNLNDPTIKEQIYERYLKAYKKGAFNYIKEDPTPEGQVVPRKYFSGGLIWTMDLQRDGAMSTIRADGAMFALRISLEKPGIVVAGNNSSEGKDAAMRSVVIGGSQVSAEVQRDIGDLIQRVEKGQEQRINKVGKFMNVYTLPQYPHLVFKIFKSSLKGRHQLSATDIHSYEFQVETLNKIINDPHFRDYFHQIVIDGIPLILTTTDLSGQRPIIVPFGYFGGSNQVKGIIEVHLDTSNIRPEEWAQVVSGLKSIGLFSEDLHRNNIGRYVEYHGRPVLLDNGGVFPIERLKNMIPLVINQRLLDSAMASKLPDQAMRTVRLRRSGKEVSGELVEKVYRLHDELGIGTWIEVGAGILNEKAREVLQRNGLLDREGKIPEDVRQIFMSSVQILNFVYPAQPPVSIVRISNNQGTFQGTGFVVGKDADYYYVMTNEHVVNKLGKTADISFETSLDDQSASFAFSSPDLYSVKGDIIAQEETPDIALIRISVRNVAAFPLSAAIFPDEFNDNEDGHFIFGVKFKMGAATIDRKRINAQKAKDGKEINRLYAENMGFSGSPVMQGDGVIGMFEGIRLRDDIYQGGIYAIPVYIRLTEIKSFLERHIPLVSIEPPRRDLKPEEIRGILSDTFSPAELDSYTPDLMALTRKVDRKYQSAFWGAFKKAKDLIHNRENLVDIGNELAGLCPTGIKRKFNKYEMKSALEVYLHLRSSIFVDDPKYYAPGLKAIFIATFNENNSANVWLSRNEFTKVKKSFGANMFKIIWPGLVKMTLEGLASDDFWPSFNPLVEDGLPAMKRHINSEDDVVEVGKALRELWTAARKAGKKFYFLEYIFFEYGLPAVDQLNHNIPDIKRVGHLLMKLWEDAGYYKGKVEHTEYDGYTHLVEHNLPRGNPVVKYGLPAKKSEIRTEDDLRRAFAILSKLADTLQDDEMKWSAKMPSVRLDNAMMTDETMNAFKTEKSKTGGIDLDQINVLRNGRKVLVQFDPAQLNQLEQGVFEGFTPVIINITRISSPFQLLGINPANNLQVLTKA